MKPSLTAFIIVLSFVLSEHSFAAPPTFALERATVSVPRTRSAPLPDGVLNEDCWKSSTEVGPFVVNTGKRLASEQTRAWLCYDDDALYIAFRCKESALDPVRQQAHLVKAQAAGHDDPRIFRDDIVEVFVQPEPNKPYFHFALSTVNARYEQKRLDVTWNGGWNGYARVGDGEWTAEFVILYDSLESTRPLPMSRWRINLCRQERPRGEFSTWSGLTGSFHQVSQFGTIVFFPGSPIVRDVNLMALPTGEYAISSVVWNPGPAPITLQLRGVASSSNGRVGGHTEFTLDPNGQTPVNLQVAIGELSGDVSLQYQLVQPGVEPGKETVLDASAPLPIFQAVARGIATVQASGRVSLFVNGQLIDNTRGDSVTFQLHPGVNVFAIQAAGGEGKPWVDGRFRFETTTIETDERWKLGTSEIKGWNSADFDDSEWQRATRVAPGRVWSSAPNGSDVFLRRLVVLSDPDEVVWPHSNEVILPAGSVQLLWALIDAPPQHLNGPLLYHMDAPKELIILGTEPLHGITPAKLEQTGSPRGPAFKRYTMRFPAMPANGFVLSVRFGNVNEETLKTTGALRVGGTFDWTRWTETQIVSDRAYSMQPSLCKPANGGVVGTIYFDDFEIRDAEGKVLFKEDFEGSDWNRSRFIATEMRDGKPTRCLKMEATISNAAEAFFQTLSESPIPIEPGSSVTFSCVARGERIIAPGPPARLALVTRREKTSLSDARIFTGFELDDGAVTEIPRVITVRAVPPLNGIRPSMVRLIPCYYNDYFTVPEVNDSLADSLIASGVNWMYGRGTNRVMRRAREKGLRLIYSLEWDPYMTTFARGFLKETPDARAINATGGAMNQTICPSFLLQPESPFVALLNQFVARKIREQQPAEVNWDFEQPVTNPPTFCFDERCRRNFATAARLPDVPTREQILGDEVLRAQWTDFRCQQNAMTIALVRRAVMLADPNMPFSVYSGFQTQYSKEHYGIDWTMVAPVIDVAICGYNGTDELIGPTLAALGKTPLIGGQMWLETLSVTESGRLDHSGWQRRLLDTIVNTGGKGVLFWWLPTMSGGAFDAIADLTRFLSSYEKFIVANQRRDDLAQVLTRGYRPDDAKLLVLDQERLLLLFNEAREAATVRIRNVNLPKEYEVRVIGEARPRNKTDEMDVTIPAQHFAAVHMAPPRKHAVTAARK